MTQAAHRFDIISADFKRDPRPTCAAMRAAGSFIPVRMPIVGNIMMATTHASVDRLLKASDQFSVDFMEHGRSKLAFLLRLMPGSMRPLTENMLQKDGAAHRRLRKLVDGAFRRKDIDALRPRIEQIADQLIDRLEASDDGDLVQHVARDLPLAVICEMLGLPLEDRPKFTRWMSTISEKQTLTGVFLMLRSIKRINTYLLKQIELRRQEPRDDLMSALVEVEEEGDRLSGNELLAMIFLLFVAGHETTTHLISGGTLALMQHPTELERLRADPDLALSATDELLRFVCPVQMTKPRMPFADMEFEGVHLRKGQLCIAHLASANFDPAVFDQPDTFDITRKPNKHMAFGAGPHFCLGAWLARSEMEIYLRCLLDRARNLRMRIDEDQVVWRKGTGIRSLKALPIALSQ